MKNQKTNNNSNEPSRSNELDRQRIRGLIIKGFGKEEIKKITGLDEDLINEVIDASANKESDIARDSVELYSELQKDLAKLVMLENAEKNGKRDTSTIMNAIKLQAELQEKKIQLQSHGVVSVEKISKNYIKDRDREIMEAKNTGLSFDQLAEKFGMSKPSINQAIDRASFELPADLADKTISPSLVSETRGLDKDTRIKIIRDALASGLDRMQVRAMVNKIKNETR